MRNPPTQNGVALTNKLDSPWSAKMIGRKRRTALVALIVSAVFSGAAAATVDRYSACRKQPVPAYL